MPYLSSSELSDKQIPDTEVRFFDISEYEYAENGCYYLAVDANNVAYLIKFYYQSGSLELTCGLDEMLEYIYKNLPRVKKD